MLRKRTDSASARSFKRIAQLTLVGIALAGLAACGGGGGGSSTPAKDPTPAPDPASTPTPPEIPITPAPTDVPPPTEAELAAATVLTAGETVDGTLESADDVKYYRLEIAETSVVELTIDAEAGTEIALLDSSGRVVLAQAITASEATLRHTVVKDVYLVRALAKKINESRAFRFVNKVTKISKYAGTVINIITLNPKYDIPLGRLGEINIDLRGIFDSSQPLKFSIGGEFGIEPLGTLSGRIVRDQLRLSPTSDAVPTTLRLIVKATPADVDNIPGASVPIEVTLSGIMVEPRYRTGVIEFLDPGETYTSPNLGDYFLYPEGAQIAFNLTETRRLPSESNWTRRITDSRLVVSTTSVRNGDLLGITVTATDPRGRTADLLVTVTVQYSPTVKSEYESGVVGMVAPGETYTSENLGDYFDYPEGAQINFTLRAGRPEPNREGWTHGIENGRLVISSASNMDPGDHIPLVVYARVDPAGPENAELSFVVMVEEELTPPPPAEEPFEPFVCALPDTGEEWCNRYWTTGTIGGLTRSIVDTWIANGEIRLDFVTLKTLYEEANRVHDTMSTLQCGNFLAPQMASIDELARRCGSLQCEATGRRGDSFMERVCDLGHVPPGSSGWRIPGIIGE